MQLEQIHLNLRPRESWDVVDLGFAMLRHYWKAVYLPWLALFLAAATVLYLLFLDSPWIAGLILWWLKPALERMPLYVLSHALFGEVPSFKQTLKNYPKVCWRGLIASLTIYRLLLWARSFCLPIWQLEQLSGRKWRKRKRVLQKRVQSQAIWLTAICLNFELVVQITLLGLLAILMPIHNDFNLLEYLFSAETQGSALAEFLLYGVTVIGVAIIEPFYVAAGFALYLNRRSQLEGWDIELAFRQAANRIQRLENPIVAMEGSS